MTDSREILLPHVQPLPVTLRALLALTKPRVAFASILTALAGYAATAGRGGLTEHLALLLGAGLAAGGTLAFNQWWERDTDPFMGRTRQRPLVQGRITPGLALAWSTFLTLAGIALLAAAFNVAAAAVATAICVIYGFIYTPMKRCTH